MIKAILATIATLTVVTVYLAVMIAEEEMYND